MDDDIVSGYISGSIVTESEPQIVKDIRDLELNEEIKENAIRIYYDVMESGVMGRTKSVKEGRKYRMIFYCISEAYSQNGEMIEPKYLGRILGLKESFIDKAMMDHIGGGIKIYDPINILKFYAERLNEEYDADGMKLKFNSESIIEGAREVIERCRETDAGSEWLNNNAVKCVGIAALAFYVNDIMGSNVERKYFERIATLPWSCIKNSINKVIMFYNGVEMKKAPTLYFNI